MAGRPSKYKKEYTDQAYKFCLLGATDADLARMFETTEQTINAWKQQHPEFLESIKKGKELADAEVAQKLFKRATGYKFTEIKETVNEAGFTATTETIKEIPPDTTAQIFWLKNRNPKQWRDKQEITSTNTNINTDISDLPPEERQKRIDELLRKMEK